MNSDLDKRTVFASTLVEDGVRRILHGLGENPDREGLKDTPDRVARMFKSIFKGYADPPPDLTIFKEEPYDGIVSVHGIPFFSYCEHHMVPYVGTFAISYMPKDKVIGLSKLVRLFRWHAQRLSIQERLTVNVIDHLIEALEPKGAMVYVTAAHMCMTLRGVRSPGAMTTTSAARGVFQTNDDLRTQFLEIVRHG